MSSGHIHTWLRFLEELTPLGHDQTIHGAELRLATAEALSYAAPQGPRGFPHQVDCDCPTEDVGPLFPPDRR